MFDSDKNVVVAGNADVQRLKLTRGKLPWWRQKLGRLRPVRFPNEKWKSHTQRRQLLGPQSRTEPSLPLSF